MDLVTAKPFPLVLQTVTYIFPMDSKFYSGKTEAGKDKAEIVKNGDSFASTNVSGTGPFSVKFREQGVKRWNTCATPTTGTRPPRATSKTRPWYRSGRRHPCCSPAGRRRGHDLPVAPNDLERVKNSRIPSWSPCPVPVPSSSS